MALKVDHSLMASLDRWLSRYGITMPQSVLRTIDEMELCPNRASDGLVRKYTRVMKVSSGPDLGEGSKLGSCPEASTTKGPPQKTVKNYYLKILFETNNLE